VQQGVRARRSVLRIGRGPLQLADLPREHAAARDAHHHLRIERRARVRERPRHRHRDLAVRKRLQRLALLRELGLERPLRLLPLARLLRGKAPALLLFELRLLGLTLLPFRFCNLRGTTKTD
jgi:hypothetical protein